MQNVYAGGTIVDTQDFGTGNVSSGAIALGTTISFGGTEYVLSDALRVNGTTIGSGGTEYVLFGGIDGSATVSGDIQDLGSGGQGGGRALITTIEAGGAQTSTPTAQR